MEGQKVSREEALSRVDHKQACHILLYSDTNAKLFKRIPIKHIVLLHCKQTVCWIRPYKELDVAFFLFQMQMRFDGLLGFPGGLVKPSEESLEAGLMRELQEELGVAVPVTVDNYVYSHIPPFPPRLITHFYIKKVKEAELLDIEKAAVCSAADHGLEVLGMVRVPLYTMRNGGGLSWFLSHSFIGNSRSQLLGALQRLGLVSPQALEEAVKQAEIRRHSQNAVPH